VVEHSPCKRAVVSSILTGGSTSKCAPACADRPTARPQKCSMTGCVSRRCHNLLQSRRGRRQCAVLRMYIGPHGERRVGVPEPRGDDRDRDGLRVHDAGAGMPCIVQPNLPNLGLTANGIPLQLRRRRCASWRRPQLNCGCADPWPCRCTEPPLSERAVDSWRDAAQHILATGAMPIVPIEVRRALWRRQP
jgi:hypothetical protein